MRTAPAAAAAAAALLVVLPAPLLSPGPALAQPRPFNCVGAERLEDDVFAIPFAPRKAAPNEAARGNLEAAAALAKREPERNLCVLGHADPQEGGAATGAKLAARRAGAVADALARLGVERDRVRAEAHRAAFARGGAVPAERSVTVVVMPPAPGEKAAEAGPSDAR
jgi:outer membrane protein OmpA-like peptidoglycan-associated protein